MPVPKISNGGIGIKALALCLGLISGACSNSGGGGSSECDIDEQNRFVHNEMLKRYYWYQQVPTRIEYDSFDSPQQTLNYLRYGALDRFSYIAEQSSFENLVNNGTYIGYGFSYVIENGSRAFLRFVYDQSPAASAGMQRGDEILSVNGHSVTSIIAANSWDALFGPAQIGLPLSIQLQGQSGPPRTLNISKATVIVNTVLHSEIINTVNDTIGYLVFNSFLNTSLAELDPVFEQFKLAGVDELILDLRYNGGGSIFVARELASYIKDTSLADTDLYVELRYNDKSQADNFRYYFRPQVNSLGLDEVTVITSASTCSASEQVISALLPYFSRVTTMGSESCGKPVGMNPTNFCELTLLAVNFAGFNADGQGDYFSGIPADCGASDDVSLDFGDPAESMLQTARNFVDSSTCPAARRAARQQVPNQLKGLQLVAGAV